MKIFTDTHVHTIACTHAYSTVLENARGAAKKCLEAIVISDHGCGLPDSPHHWHFENMKVVPRQIEGVTIIRGIEANIMDYDGNLDMEPRILRNLEWVNCGMHNPIFISGTIEENTNAYLGALKNQNVDALVHIGNGNFPIDYEKVVLCAKKYNKVIEINNHSFEVRKNSTENCTEIAKLCKKHKTSIVVSSDAHYCDDVGKFDNSIKMLQSIEFPENLIVNITKKRLLNYILERKGIDLLEV